MVRGRRGRVKNGTMSANGTKRTLMRTLNMSAFGGKANSKRPPFQMAPLFSAIIRSNLSSRFIR